MATQYDMLTYFYSYCMLTVSCITLVGKDILLIARLAARLSLIRCHMTRWICVSLYKFLILIYLA